MMINSYYYFDEIQFYIRDEVPICHFMHKRSFKLRLKKKTLIKRWMLTVKFFLYRSFFPIPERNISLAHFLQRHLFTFIIGLSFFYMCETFFSVYKPFQDFHKENV